MKKSCRKSSRYAMANEPPAKRKRPADVTEPHLTKCGEPSFDDGNIIIAVERTHFRVYRGVLASLSSVFANMFTNPRPTTANMRNDGCPVIELTDSAEDWEIVLKAYFLRSYDFVETAALPLRVVTAYLRLGTKYDMTGFRADAVKRLTYEYPSTLEALDKLDHYTRISKCESVVHELFSVMDLAKKYNIPEVLPWAFYCCCCNLSVKQICSPTPPYLSREDLQTCLDGREQLLRHQAKYTFAWLHSDCLSHVASCNAAKQSLCDKYFRPVPACVALDCWGSIWHNGLCRQCTLAAKGSHEAGRKQIWNKLPSIFGLPEWAEVTDH